eukprot:TRINITY_DN956_c0_g1_i5.p2 TRINITY_DN956_c0_g1~~TRINITY_DN956_c0_g1_i5.p2  ORF type:complete len:194 (+),score=80.96 TRINITY_DN956_c0_g1_i5:401-982(+)
MAFVGKKAPAFNKTALVNGEFKKVSLDDYKGKWFVLFFYPLDFTFVCPTEIIAFSDRAEEFRKLGCELAACSVDSEYSHFAWVNTPRKEGGLGPMHIPIISDLDKKMAAEYGVLLQEAGVALRGLFIIDPKQTVRQITINDLPVGRSVDETLRLLQAFQFVEEHGEVCPAGWHKGQEAMKPTAAGVKSYLASH